MTYPFTEVPEPGRPSRPLPDNTLDAFLAFDGHGLVLEWSPHAEKALGWKKEELLGKSLAEAVIPARFHALHQASLQRVLDARDEPGGTWRVEMAVQHKDGAEVPVELALMSARINGHIVLFGALRDLSQAKALEQEGHRQAQQWQEQARLLDLSRDAIMVRTTADIITYWNRGASRLYGYTREEACGQIGHVLLKTCFPAPLEDLQAYLLAHHYWEGELVHTARDGREITVFSRWTLELLDGHPHRYLETNTDVTHRMAAQRALHRSREDLRQIVEASTEHAIMMIGPDGNIRSWNAGAEHIIGLSAQEAIGMPMAQLFTPEDMGMGEPVRELEEARIQGRSEADRWHVRRDGTRFWATGVVTPQWNADGSLRGYTKIMRDRTEQRLQEEQTHFLASHDVLTGLPNRVSFSNQLHQAMALAQRNDTPLTLLLLDLDRFKTVNDTFGHHTGDLLLKEVAARVQSTLRETDFIARLGGDEFVLLQTGAGQPEAAETLARKLVLELGRPYRLDDQEVLSGASIGICFYPRDGKDPVELLKRADLALYRAKTAGRHTFEFYTPALCHEHDGKKGRENLLRAALRDRQFELYYQPQVDLRNWRIASVEALLRWNASELETVLPADFLEIAEQSGLIVEIGEWALREAGHQVRRWQAQGMTALRLSVNCSARQFSDANFVQRIPDIMRDVGLAPGSLELEVPEAMLAHRPELRERLVELRAQGIRLAIDNFGTGATALIDLKDLGIDVLKIDKAFVRHLPHRRADAAITSAIITLAHNLGVDVVAGGVETAEQLAYLKARDCASAQGFIFSPPVPAEELEALMLGGQWSRINGAMPFDGHGAPRLH